MKTTLFLLSVTVGLVVVGQDARASGSSFRVVGSEVKGDALLVSVAWKHQGNATPVEFYAHDKIQSHNDKKEQFRAGLKLDAFDMEGGAGQKVISIPLASLKTKLSLSPGQTVHLAALWPKLGGSDYGHRWGTDYRKCETSVTIPGNAAAANSRLARAAGLRRAKLVTFRLVGRCGRPAWQPLRPLRPKARSASTARGSSRRGLRAWRPSRAARPRR